MNISFRTVSANQLEHELCSGPIPFEGCVGCEEQQQKSSNSSGTLRGTGASKSWSALLRFDHDVIGTTPRRRRDAKRCVRLFDAPWPAFPAQLFKELKHGDKRAIKTFKQASPELGLPYHKIQRAAKRGLFPTYRLLDKRPLVRVSEAVAAIEACRVESEFGAASISSTKSDDLI